MRLLSSCRCWKEWYKGVKQFAVMSETNFLHLLLFVFYIYMAKIVHGNVMQAAAFSDCVYIPFADSVCSLPGPVNIITAERKCRFWHNKKTQSCSFISAPSSKEYHLHYFFWQGEWFEFTYKRGMLVYLYGKCNLCSTIFMFLQIIPERYFHQGWHITPVMMAQHWYLTKLKICRQKRK